MPDKFELIPIDDMYQIRALRDFSDVKAGDLGGFVKNEACLSHDGDCWIYNLNNGKPSTSNLIYKSTDIQPIKQPYIEDSRIYDDSKIYGRSLILDSVIYGDSVIYSSIVSSSAVRSTIIKNSKLIKTHAHYCNFSDINITDSIFNNLGKSLIGNGNVHIKNANIDGHIIDQYSVHFNSFIMPQKEDNLHFILPTLDASIYYFTSEEDLFRFKLKHVQSL